MHFNLRIKLLKRVQCLLGYNLFCYRFRTKFTYIQQDIIIMLASVIRSAVVKQYKEVLLGKIMVSSSSSKGIVSSRFYSHQESLPRLPVPPLHQTLEKYLKTVRPLVSDDEYENTKSLVESFGAKGGYGEHLHEKLLEHAKTKENWLSDWWLDCAYLESRASVVIYCSPSVSFPKYNFSGTSGQIEHAAKLITALLKYKVNIDNETIPVEKLGKFPLCMDQYYRILSACRIPGITKDNVHCHAKSWIPPSHITVIHNNQFFELDVYHQDKSPLTTSELETQLSRIVAASNDSAVPLGILTSRDRDNWGRAYHTLAADEKNKECLKSIERSIFALCLDKEVPSVPEEEWRHNFGARLLHGGGSTWNSGNRWFDKTIQMIVDKTGGVGLAYEHSPAEGPPIAAMLDYVYEYIENADEEPKSSILNLPPPKHLQFNIPDSLLFDVKKASKELDDLISHLNLVVVDYKDYGKDFIKSMKMSPDSYIQIAMQLAYYRLHHAAPATYESASLRRFRLGRTDTIRSCSIESQAFTQAAASNDHSITELAQLLRNAVVSHRQYTTDAVAGQAIDRHLLGLRLIAKKSGEEEPLIFKDSTYKRAMSFNLSTSQVPCKADLSMAFGPAVDDGYGICYNPKSNRILFSISSWKSLPDYDVEPFQRELFKALRDMKDILLSGSSKL